MTDFTETIHRRGKAEEDIFFAKQDQKLIQALHDQQAKQRNQDANTFNNSGSIENSAENKSHH